MDLMLHSGAQKLGRQELLSLPTPESTETHTIVPHSKIVGQVLEALAYRKVSVVKDEYGVSKDGSRMFGVLTLDIERHGVSLALGLRNSHDKSFAIGMVAGFRVFVCDNLAFKGEFFAVARRHSKNVLSQLDDTLAIGVDRVQRQFEPMTEQIDAWRGFTLSDGTAKEIMFDAFIGGQLDCAKHLAPAVAKNYFEPTHDEFRPRTAWSLQNAFTESFKQLDPIPMYKATTSLGEFFERIN
jgi:hypothetical protein